MRRFYLRRALRAAPPSLFEELALLGGVAMVVAAVVAAIAGEDAGGLTARLLGTAGLGAIAACAASRGIRRHRAGVTASLPTSVARVAVRARPARAFTAITLALSLGLPAAAVVAVLGLLAWGWLVIAAMLLVGSVTLWWAWLHDGRRGEERYSGGSDRAEELLRRLCMRADMRVPGFVVRYGTSATAWTAGGRIHVTTGLLDLLDDGELEAVLAHELAHLAHRDASAMEICSAPSRILLAFAATVWRRLVRVLRDPKLWFIPGISWFLAFFGALAVFCAPPAFVIGWVSRLSMLGLSRARELSADAAAATLTGRPSALASALLKLERQRERTPRSDLRAVEPSAVLCIVGTDGAGLGRPFRTHPAVAARVRRLEALEARIRGHAAPR